MNVDELNTVLQTMIGKLKVGDVSEVIRTQRGYQLLMLESRAETKIRSFDDARTDISDKIAEQKRRGETQKYLEKLRGQASITFRNDQLKAAYDQALLSQESAEAQLRTAEASLEATKAQADVFVVDKVSRPSEN